jgi:hypothetical protein
MNGPLRATGVVSITMVMSLRRFVRRDDGVAQPWPQRYWRRLRGLPEIWQTPPSIELYEQVRGTKSYAEFLRTLKPARWFVIDEDEQRIERDGHALSIFRNYLIENFFFPTYRLTDPSLLLRAMPGRDPALLHELAAWAFKLRLTRNGLVVVKLERALDNMPFVDISRMLLDRQRRLSLEESEQAGLLPSQWQLSMDLVARFVEACGERFTVTAAAEESGPRSRSGEAKKQRQRSTVIGATLTHSAAQAPLHDYHVTYNLSQVVCDAQQVDVKRLRAEHAKEVIGLVEQTLLRDNAQIYYPLYKQAHVDNLFAGDISSWESELCLITPAATFIYCPALDTPQMLLSGSPRNASTTAYSYYWRSIVRGIEHIVAFKSEIQLVERETTRLLEDIPEMTRKAADGNLSPAERWKVRKLATETARLLNALPRHRDALVTSSMFRASYAAAKFQLLIELLGILQIEEHIQTNVQELSAFVAHFNDIQLQQDSRRTSQIFGILTLILSSLVIPSVLADFVQYQWLSESVAGRLFQVSLVAGIVVVVLLIGLRVVTRR